MMRANRVTVKDAHKRGNSAAPAERKAVTYATISPEEEGQRIDNYLFRICKGVPKSHIYRVLRSGEVRVNKGRVDQTYRLAAGDVLRIPPLQIAERAEKHIPERNFKVLYEDAHLLVIDKPAGVAVHGGSGVSYGVIEQLRATRPHEKFLELVHRLDRETSGILLVAKKRSALTRMHEQMRSGTVDKRYQVMVHGDWKNQRQHVKLPLQKFRTGEGERRVRVQEGGQASHTIFNVLRSFGDFTLLEAELKTGRTHQIRVHLSSMGYAIAGDDKYGDFALNKELQRTQSRQGTLKRMFLHAHRITFRHPESGEEKTIEAGLPPDLEGFAHELAGKPDSDE